jgi:cytochrome b561
MAVLILGLFALGLYMHELHLSPTKIKLYNWHKWTGVTVFLLLWVRLLWLAAHPAPALPGTMPSWQRVAAKSGHGLLYLLILAVPLSGWLMSSAKGFQTVYFGVLPIPDLLGKNLELGEQLEAVHKWLNIGFMVLVAGHALAAIWHHRVDRDGVLRRMVPWLREKEELQ